MTTGLSFIGTTRTKAAAISPKAASGLPPLGQRIADFDTWRPGYAGAIVEVIVAGTTDFAPLYSDPFLTAAIANPQTLLTLTDENGQTYGRWATGVYTYVPWRLFVDNGNQTAIQYPPLVTLDGADITYTTAISRRGGYPVSTTDYLDRDIDALLYGPLSEASGASVCNATLLLAVGAAAALGGGDVLLPFGTIPFLGFTLPQGVRLKGRGKGATILISTQTGDPCIVLGGDGAGLVSLTLDGLDLAPQSIGVSMVAVAQPAFDDVAILRFETGIRAKGLIDAVWTKLSVSNCSYGVDLRGDLDASVSSAGSEVSNLRWIGGDVSLCTQFGLGLLFFDASIRDLTFENIEFSTNSGDAIRMIGARGVRFRDCQWISNISNLSMADGTNLTYVSLNTTQRTRFEGGRMNAGRLTFNQTCLDTQLVGMDLENISMVLSVPTFAILLLDCIQDANVTATGDLSKLLIRDSSNFIAATTGVTTDAVPIAAWQLTLEPGQTCLIEAKGVARARNDITYGVFWVASGANRPGSTLPYQVQTGNFTVGLVLTGATSGASARITADADAGATGTLTLRDIVGTFINGETVHDSASGSARFVGVLGNSNAVLDGGGSTVMRAAATTGGGWAMAMAVSGAAVRVLITGEAAKTIEWEVDVDLLLP